MGRWIVNSVSQGVASSEAELVRSLEGSTLPSSEAEVRFAVEGLGSGGNSASLEATPRQLELATHLLTGPSDRSINCQPLHHGVRTQTMSGHHVAQQP